MESKVSISTNGNNFWYNEKDQLHRLDGPAIELANGTKCWYVNDHLHRLDGPAIEKANGNKAWYINGKRHRLDGPAIDNIYGFKEWWVNDRLHRLNGPVIIWRTDDGDRWLINLSISYDPVMDNA